MTDRKEQFTPGPWVADWAYRDVLDSIKGPDGQWVIIASTQDGEKWVETDNPCDVPLIRSAPCLYGALKRVLEYDVFGQLPRELTQRIEDVLAKARGE